MKINKGGAWRRGQPVENDDSWGAIPRQMDADLGFRVLKPEYQEWKSARGDSCSDLSFARAVCGEWLEPTNLGYFVGFRVLKGN